MSFVLMISTSVKNFEVVFSSLQKRLVFSTRITTFIQSPVDELLNILFYFKRMSFFCVKTKV